MISLKNRTKQQLLEEVARLRRTLKKLEAAERKETKQALNSNGEKYSNLFHHSHDAIFIHDLAGHILDVNNKVLDLFGYKKSEILILQIPDLHPESDLELSREAFREIKKKGFVHFECRFKKKDGEIFPAEVSSSLFKVGRKSLVQNNVRDITERRRVQEALIESSEMYKTLVETFPDAVTATDLQGNITFASPRTLQLHGYDHAEELLGKNAFELIAPEDQDEAKKNLQACLKEGFVRNLQYAFVRKDESRFIGELNASLIKDVNGESKALIAVTRDITKRIRAEQVLSENEKRFRGVVENANDAIYIITPQGFEYVNSAFENLTGYTSKEMCRKTFNFWSIIHPEDVKMIREREEARKKGENVPSRYEFRILAKDGSTKIVEPATVNIGEKGEAKVMGILRDVTERKHAEEKLRSSLQEKKVMLREIHHRVKNNMQIVSSLLRLQCRAVKDNNMLEMFKESQNRIRSMALIHEKLYQTENFSRINFAQYIRSLTVHLFHTYKVNPNIVKIDTQMEDVFLDINKAIPCGLIINELVSNALKHAFQGKQKGEIRIRLSSENQKKNTLTVGDTGTGLPPEVNFSHPDTLGLQLVRDLVKQIDGSIKMSRAHGTTFTITF